ncbi:MAG TPA: hypothetical protein PLI68_10970 [Bacteroidia bacterium]|nr:hypothetical protein [Bacteroidia bacterium]HRH07365.1 hypothetical protein [Bacteroidia bacterium]HRH63838.1 hypothetical protein [Bacteroidia bacterium]
MNKRIYLIWLLIFLLSCKKQNVEEIAHCEVAEDLAAYSFFKKGTYWIYQDSISGMIDSVYVYFDTNFVYHNPGWGIIAEGDYPFYSMSSYSVKEQASLLYITDYGDYKTNSTVGALRKRVGPGAGHGSAYFMVNTFQKGIYLRYYGAFDAVTFENYFEDKIIKGRNFQSVAKFGDKDNATEFRNSTLFYVAKNVGIIRKEIIDSNQVWNLIRFKIVQ